MVKWSHFHKHTKPSKSCSGHCHGEKHWWTCNTSNRGTWWYQNILDNASQIYKQRLSNHMEHIYVITCIRTHYEMAMSHTTHFSRSCHWWNICYIVSIIISTFWVYLHYQDCTAVIAKHKLDEPKPGKILQKRGPFTLYLTLLTRWLVPPPHTIHLTNYSQQHSFRFRPWSCTSRYGYRRQPPFIITNANQTKLFYSGYTLWKSLEPIFFHENTPLPLS